MGCGSSSDAGKLQTVDDSVHVMLAHDKKMQQRHGEAPHGYVPRAPHPLLQQKQQGGASTGGGGGGIVATEEDDAGGGDAAAGGATSGADTSGTGASISTAGEQKQ